MDHTSVNDLGEDREHQCKGKMAYNSAQPGFVAAVQIQRNKAKKMCTILLDKSALYSDQ